MKWERISTAEEFPHAAIYEAPGPVYTISFYNREIIGPWQAMLGGIAATLIFGAVLWAMTDLSLALWEWLGIPRYVTIIAAIAAGIAGGAWLFHPPMVRREIVFDIPRDRVLIYRRSRQTLDRKLSMLKNITIADHPDTELERARRPGKGPGPLEKQHCLMGWFGAGDTGVNQEILMTRYEFPKIHSLFEVGQAMIWTRKRYMSAVPSPSTNFVPVGDDAGPTSIKPPLD